MDSKVIDFILDDAPVDALQTIMPLILPRLSKTKRRGSLPGRAANKNRRPDLGQESLQRDYLGLCHVYSDNDFRRRFRVPKAILVFYRLCDDLVEADSLLKRRKDATGKCGTTTQQKITAALRILGYGVSADAVDEYCRLAESTAMKYMKLFCAAVVKTYQEHYLRQPSTEDIQRILATNAERGFPGMVGSLDCMHWFWEKCPRAWSGQVTGKDGKPSIVLEAVATQDFCNDINILDRSPLLRNIYNVKSLGISYTINGHERRTPYYLTDGIYPEWSVFLKSFSVPDTQKKKHYSKMHEACRKDVERAFGVLQGRWHILAKPCKLWFKEDMAIIMRACIILHNMIIEHDTMTGASQEEINQADDCVHFVPCDFSTFKTNMANVRDTNEHRNLRNDIIEHLRSIKGLQE
ncbi:hypothetical protein LEN26_013342 [Aphanomyces euteiches]|nr:hypothetical protein LEN26_013342 [Aphanomyces euteiches]